MFIDFVAPWLRPEAGRVVQTRVVHTFGLGESEVAARLGELMDRGRNPLLGTTASRGVVSCRMRFEGAGDAARAAAELAATARTIEDRLGAYVFAEGATTLPEAVLAALRGRGERVAVAESCTGGMLGALLTEPAGASDVFAGGWILYSNEAKTETLGVGRDLLSLHGAVSGEVASAMARAALSLARVSDGEAGVGSAGGVGRAGNVDHALAITGIAGPGGGSAEKPVGTVWIARAWRAGREILCERRRFLFAGEREHVREWSAKAALGMLWLHTRGQAGLPLLRQQERSVE